MKYSARLYAKALAEAASQTTAKENDRVIRNFLALVKRNGDQHLLAKILSEAERRIRATTGKRMITFETARPARELRKTFARFVTRTDIVQEHITPALIAGVRITINDGLQFDGSLKRKLDKLFS